jgi:hypothetical protein
MTKNIKLFYEYQKDKPNALTLAEIDALFEAFSIAHLSLASYCTEQPKKNVDYKSDEYARLCRDYFIANSELKLTGYWAWKRKYDDEVFEKTNARKDGEKCSGS